MAIPAKGLSVADLEQLLSTKKMQLDNLHKKRSKLQQDLAAVEKEIGRLEGSRRTTAKTGATTGTKTKVVRKRRKNKSSLRAVVTNVLAQHKKGLVLGDLEAKVSETGYKSGSKNFKSVLYQCLYHNDDFTHDKKTGLYKLKAS